MRYARFQLGGGTAPAGYDAGSLADLLENINNSFPPTGTSAWALEHLSAPMIVVQCAGQGGERFEIERA